MLQTLYFEIDDKLCAKDYIGVDWFLKNWNVDDIVKTIGILTITLPAKEHLPSRVTLYQKTKDLIGEGFQDVLKGLE